VARWIDKLRHFLRSLFHRGRVEEELSEELRFHLEKQVELNRAKGMSAEQARTAALRDFGGVEAIKEECRDARGVRFLEDTWRDVCYGARMLRKSPGFTIVAILTLALGIGANAAIFSVVSAVLVRGLPFRDQGQLAALFQTPEKMPGPELRMALRSARRQSEPRK
jgi:putative ABC transport system permease protein